MSIRQITMCLQPIDCENAEHIRQHLGLTSKADAVSWAVDLARNLYDIDARGSDIVIVGPDGSKHQLHLPR